MILKSEDSRNIGQINIWETFILTPLSGLGWQPDPSQAIGKPRQEEMSWWEPPEYTNLANQVARQA